MKQILLATNNQGKIERFRKLVALAGIDVELKTLAELGIEEIDVLEDGATLEINAKKKATAYFGKVDMPILANDTGFWLETEGFIDAPKRMALNGEDESFLSKEEISSRVLEFWKSKAKEGGGKINAAWIEAFVLLNSEGSCKATHSRREIILTENEYGIPPLQMPVRALYISKTTGKPAIQHTSEEELLELQPVVAALKELLD